MRQQVFDPAGRVRRQPFEHVLEVRVGLVAVDAGRVQQAHDRGGPFSRAQAPCEQPVRPPECDRTDVVFDPVVRDRHLAIFDEASELTPAVQAVVDRLNKFIP